MMTIEIGNIQLANNVVVAPMSGVSDLPFRLSASQNGAGLVVSEMVACRELVSARADVVRRAEGDPSIQPFALQLVGRDPQWMAEGARLGVEAGAEIIDINMGCPSRQVTGVLSGSALMREPELALSLIKATVGAVSVPVTLKMRLGWDFDQLNAPFFAREAEALGVKMITVHGRTRNQFYKGKADWDLVGEVRAATSLPLIVNGDIVDLATARQALRASGADGVMIGRACIGRAWLPGAIARALSSGAAEIDAPDLAAQALIFAKQYERMMSLYGSKLGVRVARKHLAGFIDHLPIGSMGEARQLALQSLKSRLCQWWSPDDVLGAVRLIGEGQIEEVISGTDSACRKAQRAIA